ncbi:hypothetical protein KC363_g77 [Hortaea werneckii]|nr:hypothetical protein KC363_g77 [Hortaea werneckii]
MPLMPQKLRQTEPHAGHLQLHFTWNLFKTERYLGISGHEMAWIFESESFLTRLQQSPSSCQACRIPA